MVLDRWVIHDTGVLAEKPVAEPVAGGLDGDDMCGIVEPVAGPEQLRRFVDLPTVRVFGTWRSRWRRRLRIDSLE
jgi:hypothetical protein